MADHEGRQGSKRLKKKGSIIRRDETTYKYDVKVGVLNGPLVVREHGEGGVVNVYLNVENAGQLRDWIQQLPPDARVQLLEKRRIDTEEGDEESLTIQNLPVSDSPQEAMANQDMVMKLLETDGDDKDTEAEVTDLQVTEDTTDGGYRLSFKLQIVKKYALPKTTFKVVVLIGAFLALATAVFALFFYYVLNSQP